MSKTDRNLVSYCGQPNGLIVLVDYRQPEGHTNTVIRQENDTSAISHNIGDILSPEGHWDDALKVSGCYNLTVYAGRVEGGVEDVLDVNHSAFCHIHIEEAVPRGKYCTTQKGASAGISVDIIRQTGHGTEVDHDYGNHSDQNDADTTMSMLHVGSQADGDGPLVVRVLRATRPAIDGVAYEFAFPKPGAWYHSLCIKILNLIQ